MEFDKNKILTVVTADQAKVGQKGWFASNVETLSRLVLEEQPKELLGVNAYNAVHAFKTVFQNHALFYPAPEPTPVFNSLKEYVLAELDWVEKNCVWAGAKVRVVSNFTNPNGWEGWLNSDDFIHPSKWIGGEFVVRNVVPRGINLYLDCVRRKDGLMKDWFTVPFYVLEVVEPSKKPIIEFCKYSCEMDSFRKYANDLESQKPTYRPFANAEEFKPYRDEWFVSKCDNSKNSSVKALSYSNLGVILLREVTKNEDVVFDLCRWDEFFEWFVRENGEPCGVREA